MSDRSSLPPTLIRIFDCLALLKPTCPAGAAILARLTSTKEQPR